MSALYTAARVTLKPKSDKVNHLIQNFQWLPTAHGVKAKSLQSPARSRKLHCLAEYSPLVLQTDQFPGTSSNKSVMLLPQCYSTHRVLPLGAIFSEITHPSP